MILRRAWPLLVAVPVLACTATYGFWGGRLLPEMDLLEGIEQDVAADWLAEPIAPLVLDAAGQVLLASRELEAIGAGTAPTGAAAGGGERNPFLTVAEQRRGGTRGPVRRASETLRWDDWPTLKAIIELDGQAVAILDRGAVRVGERIDGLEVRAIDDGRVLVHGRQGERWLAIASRDESRSVRVN